MIPAHAWAAFFFGALSALSCVIGAAIGVAWRPPQRVLAAILPFGAGALLAALAFELILPAQEQAALQPTQILTPDNIGTVNIEDGFWAEPADALDQFKALWQLSS